MSLPLTARWEYCHDVVAGSPEAELTEVLRTPPPLGRYVTVPLSHDVRTVWRLGWPLALVQLNSNLTGAVDTALAGRVDALTLAGTGLGAAIFSTLAVLSWVAGLGSDPLMAQAVGALNPGRARALVWEGLVVALMASLPVVLLGVLTALGLERMGVAPDVAAVARLHLLGRLPSLPAFAVVMVLRSFLQAQGVSRPILWAAVLMNLFNGGADWVLMFGDAGLVRLGLPAVGLPALGAPGDWHRQCARCLRAAWPDGAGSPAHLAR